MDPTGGIGAGGPYEGIRRRQPAEPRPAGERRPEPVVRRPARGAPARRRLGFLPFLGRALTAYLGLSAVWRARTAWPVFAEHPLKEMAGVALLCKPVTQTDVEAGRQAFVQAFLSHIPAKDRACIDVPVIIQHMTIGIAGMHGRRGITINRNQLPPWDVVMDTVPHELLHHCAHEDYKRAIQGRGADMARAIDEGLTAALVERCLQDRNPFARLVNAMGGSSGYSQFKLPNGVDWVTAGRKLVNEVGLPTVLKAYLGGNEAAIKTLMARARKTHPSAGWVA